MRKLAELSEEDRELALTRFHKLQPHLEEGTALRVVAQAADIPFRTAQRWVAQYRSAGLPGLVRKSRVDRGARRVVSETMKAAIEGLALETAALPVTSVHRQIRDIAQLTGESEPSYWTVYDVVRQLPKSLRTLAHQGSKAYGEGFDMVHRREATVANGIWQADHVQLDIKLLREDGAVVFLIIWPTSVHIKWHTALDLGSAASSKCLQMNDGAVTQAASNGLSSVRSAK